MAETNPGFYYPDNGTPSDKVYFAALTGDKRDDPPKQNLGVAENFKTVVYTHDVYGINNNRVDFNLTIKIGETWATNSNFVDLRNFIRVTINYGQYDFDYLDADGNNYNVKMYPDSWKYEKIPGTNIWLVTLKLYLHDD